MPKRNNLVIFATSTFVLLTTGLIGYSVLKSSQNNTPDVSFEKVLFLLSYCACEGALITFFLKDVEIF